MKAKVFSHTDLDGVGARVILEYYFSWERDAEGEYEHVGNDKINERVIEFVESGEYKEYNEVFITDLPLNPDALLKLVEVADSIKVRFIDHHPTTLEKLTEEEKKTIKASFDTFVAAQRGDSCTSATLLTKLFLDLEEGHGFVADVNDYDTWRWSKNGNTRAKKLNDLLYIIGIDRFVEVALDSFDRMEDVTTGILKRYATLLEVEDERINEYITKKNAEKIIVGLDGMKAAVVSSEQYQSQLGHGLLDLNSDIDIVVMINAGKNVSLRSREGIDVSVIAKRFGGGGHPQASGFSVPDGTLLSLFNNIFN